MRQFLTTESPLKLMKMKNASNFLIKAFFVLEIFTSLFWLFRYVEKQLDEKAKVNFKVQQIIDWTTNNYNTHIFQEVKTIRQWNLVS